MNIIEECMNEMNEVRARFDQMDIKYKVILFLLIFRLENPKNKYRKVYL